MIVENEIVMRPINTVRPYIRNPRKNDKTVELLTKIIPRVGFNVPLVIDEKGIIVKGHARFVAAIRLGMTEVPCIITHADEEAIKADRITDNKISEFSEWVDDELLSEINDIDFDMSDIGLPKISLDDIPSDKTLADALKQKSTPAEKVVTKEEKFQKVKDELVSQGVTEEKANEAAEFFSNLFYKCVCDKCGHVMYIKEGDL